MKKWIKIETADDLPKEGCQCWIFSKVGGLICAAWMQHPSKSKDDENRKFWLEKASHYQVIEKPELPYG